MTLVTVLIVFLLLSAVGAFAMPSTWPHARFSPLGFMLLLLLVLFLTGHLGRV